ncbi:hypothetical protein HJG60_009425 [Phyllostomus discolor]|uniref:Uncharacterized protein n=1 Tax=Phyllostomus discolor TaxID=89673 RepID=A0A833YGF9_9CHIR|nr:hypothetical protein HJG60_009425 [Phyllostomus discolor]
MRCHAVSLPVLTDTWVAPTSSVCTLPVSTRLARRSLCRRLGCPIHQRGGETEDLVHRAFTAAYYHNRSVLHQLLLVLSRRLIYKLDFITGVYVWGNILYTGFSTVHALISLTDRRGAIQVIYLCFLSEF